MGLAIVNHAETETADLGKQFLDEFLPELTFESAHALLEMKQTGLLQRLLVKFTERCQPPHVCSKSTLYVGLSKKRWYRLLQIIEAVIIEDHDINRIEELIIDRHSIQEQIRAQESG
jgi:hypothetical protein